MLLNRIGASFRSRKVNPNPVALKKVKAILLKLLAFPLLPIRRDTYKFVLSIIKVRHLSSCMDTVFSDVSLKPRKSTGMILGFAGGDSKRGFGKSCTVAAVVLMCCLLSQDSLGISHVTEPTSTATQGVTFLLDRDIFYEIICFAMNDKDNEVSEYYQSYFIYFLL